MYDSTIFIFPCLDICSQFVLWSPLFGISFQCMILLSLLISTYLYFTSLLFHYIPLFDFSPHCMILPCRYLLVWTFILFVIFRLPVWLFFRRYYPFVFMCLCFLLIFLIFPFLPFRLSMSGIYFPRHADEPWYWAKQSLVHQKIIMLCYLMLQVTKLYNAWIAGRYWKSVNLLQNNKVKNIWTAFRVCYLS